MWLDVEQSPRGVLQIVYRIHRKPFGREWFCGPKSYNFKWKVFVILLGFFQNSAKFYLNTSENYFHALLTWSKQPIKCLFGDSKWAGFFNIKNSALTLPRASWSLSLVFSREFPKSFRIAIFKNTSGWLLINCFPSINMDRIFLCRFYLKLR